MNRLRTSIEHEGQAFVDEPVYRTVSEPNRMAAAIASVFGTPVPQRIEIVDRYERVRLRWMKPVRENGEFVRKADGSIKLELR